MFCINVFLGDNMAEKTNLNEIIKKLENEPLIKKLPPQIRKAIRERMESMNRIDFPIITLKEDDWVVAHTPIFDICAQGKTENEAVESLKSMIDDWMSDPDTKKPKIKSIMSMEIGIKTVSMEVPIFEGNSEMHEPITER